MHRRRYGCARGYGTGGMLFTSSMRIATASSARAPANLCTVWS